MYPQRSVMTCGLATALEPPHFNHAPVRGATPAPDLRIRGRVVSIHAPAWGATISDHRNGGATGEFQSTHPRGVRPPALPVEDPASTVSIHAPAWGATVRRTGNAGLLASFNPRTRVGCDTASAGYAITHTLVSIHAPAWGATPSPSSMKIFYKSVSIHAPAWGATRRESPEASG